jgi:hypothetical protein
MSIMARIFVLLVSAVHDAMMSLLLMELSRVYLRVFVTSQLWV